MYGFGGLLGGTGGVYGSGGGSGGGGFGGGGDGDRSCNAAMRPSVIAVAMNNTPRIEMILQWVRPDWFLRLVTVSGASGVVDVVSAPVASGLSSSRRRCRLNSSGSNGVSPMVTYRNPEVSRRTGMLVASIHRPTSRQTRVGLFSAAVRIPSCTCARTRVFWSVWQATTAVRLLPARLE